MARKHDELSLITDTNYGSRFNEELGEYEYVDKDGRSKTEALEEYKERANRLNAVSGVYQLTDKIISRDSELTVSVVSDPDMTTNAMNDGRNIIFNANLINDFDSDNILHLHGLNFHELSHILFSPRAGSDLIRFVRDNRYKRAISLLEEARAESMLIAKYPMTKLFLEASAMEYLVNDKTNDMGEHFFTITGRTYLPLEIRQAVADKFSEKYGADLARVIHSLIHEYRTLVFPRDFDKAKKLIARMADIVGLDEQVCQFPVPTHVHDSTMNKGRPQGKSEQERLQNKIGKTNEPTENLDDKGSSDNGEREKARAGTSGDRYEGVELDNTDFKSIANMINSRMDKIKDDEYVKQQINEARKAILGHDEAVTLVSKANFTNVQPSPSAVTIARRFGQELERIVRDNDPNWDKFNSRGKLNITRTMNPDINAIRTHFDTWDTGNPNTDIEAVILMDNSSSMGGLMQSVTESAWTIKRGIESIQGSVSLFTFNHESNVVYDKNEKARANELRYVYASGGTNPIRGLVEAERLLSMSKKSLKLAFIITDGEWSMESECNSIIKSMNDKGFITCVVFIGNYKHYTNLVENSRVIDDNTNYYLDQLKKLKHGAQVFHAVAGAKDMLEVAQTLVKSVLKEKRVA